MRLAPAVTTTVSNAGAWRFVQALLLASAAGVSAAWTLLQAGFSGGLFWSAVVVTAAVAAAAAWQLVPSQACRLVWTGATWQVGRPDRPGLLDLRIVEVAMDLGPALLLRAHPADPAVDGVPRWLVVTRREAGPDFRALCTALYGPVQVDRLAMPPSVG